MRAVCAAEDELGAADALNEAADRYETWLAALDYAARGWRVIPIAPGYKFPVGFPAWQEQATTDPRTIARWWGEECPDHGVGIVTGRESGVWVLDVDVAHGKVGAESMQALEAEHGPLPEGAEVVTGSGGRHLFLTYGNVDPEGIIRNDAGRKLGRDLDIRGDGGFVVAPPSVHPETGQRYAWEVESPADPVAPPQWLATIAAAEETPEAATRALNASGDGWPEYAALHSWSEILAVEGWTLAYVDRHGEHFWTRPGKDKRLGASATTGYTEADNLCMFSTSIPWLPPDNYTKLGYIAAARYSGDMSAAGAWMRQALDKAPIGSERWYEETFSAELRAPRSDVRDDLTSERPNGIAHLLGSAIDFGTFWATDHLAEDWLSEPVLPRGRQVMLFADPGVGKSLLALEIAAALATGRPVVEQPAGEPIPVLYIDAEMSDGDVWERLRDLAYSADDDMSRLHYHQWPELASLDTDRGGAELTALVEHYGAELVVIDTLGKTIEGEDNSADTYMRFGRYTGGRLKRMGVTTLLIDHSGHTDKGRPMGSVKKTADADVVWRLKRTDGDGLKLDATKRRIKWVPESIALTRESEPLRHVTTTTGWAHGTKEAAALLDRLGVPIVAGRNIARRMLADAGESVATDTLASALRFRKQLDSGDILVPKT